MDGITVNGLTGRLWMCKRRDGHALGLVVTVSAPDGLVEHLYLFRNSVKAELADGEAQILGHVEGTMHDIECTLCDAKRTWYEGRGALKRAVASYLAE